MKMQLQESAAEQLIYGSYDQEEAAMDRWTGKTLTGPTRHRRTRLSRRQALSKEELESAVHRS